MESATSSTPIDWSAIQQRLEAARQAVELAADLKPEQRRAILAARALALADEGTASAVGDHLQIIEFSLAHERYGFEYRFVREVYPLRDYTPLPGTPPFILGLVNVRGRLLSILDLKQLYDLPSPGLTDLNKLILLESGDMHLAVLADAVLGVRSVPALTLHRTLPTLAGLRAEFLRGLTDDRLILLDAERLLASADILVQQEVDA
jgi:purine-binding chemotaxis protein CheW